MPPSNVIEISEYARLRSELNAANASVRILWAELELVDNKLANAVDDRNVSENEVKSLRASRADIERRLQEALATATRVQTRADSLQTRLDNVEPRLKEHETENLGLRKSNRNLIVGIFVISLASLAAVGVAIFEVFSHSIY